MSTKLCGECAALLIQEGHRVYGVRLRPDEQRYDIGNFNAYFRAFVHFRIAQPALNLAFPAIRFLSFLPAGKTQNSPL